MYQHVELLGRVGNDAECQAKNRPVSFSVATWENFRDEEAENGWRTETTWHNIVAWGNPDIKKHYVSKVKKGRWVLVDGKIQKEKWTDNDGNERTSVKIVAQTIRIIPTEEAKGYKDKAQKPESPKESSFDKNSEEDDDLPF